MKRTFDPWILIFIIFLVLIGIVMIFSSSLVMASKSSFYNFDAYYFLKRQIIWLIFGSLILILAFRADWIFLRKFSLIGIIFTIILLILVLIPGIGKTVLGARRWIDLGFLSFQPSEIAKFTLIFYLADVISRKYDKFEKPSFLIIPFLILGVFCFLIEKEPDLGTVLILGGTFLGILYLGGIKKSYLLSLILSGIALVGFRILHESYRMRRLAAFINPWKDPQDSGYHIIQSLIALGSGGIFGLGLGQSRQKFFYLPEQHTDFIFAILGEELGLIGATLILLIFLGLIYRGFKVASSVHHPFLRLLASGITFMLAFEIFINLGVVTALLPPTGIPLPFISFGGSSLVINLLMAGILLNISRYTYLGLALDEK